MQKDILKSVSWQQLKTALKEKYETLTERDLQYVEGKENELYQRLQIKLGKTKSELDHLLEKLDAELKTKHEMVSKQGAHK